MPDTDNNLPTQTRPPVEAVNNTQVEDIRLMLLDALPDTYAIKTNDYYFSDAEIMDAIRRANEVFNALPPAMLRTNYYGIPDPYTLKVGAAWQACLSKCLYFQRKQVKYQAGSTEVDMYGTAAEAMATAAKEYKEQFMQLASSIKRQINTNRFFGRIG